MSIISTKHNLFKKGYVYDRRQEFLLDSVADFDFLPKDCAPGSLAYLADNSVIRRMSSSGEWVDVDDGISQADIDKLSEEIANLKESGGGSGGIFTVTVYPNPEVDLNFDDAVMPVTCDKTAEEIYEAYKKGMECVALLPDFEGHNPPRPPQRIPFRNFDYVGRMVDGVQTDFLDSVTFSSSMFWSGSSNGTDTSIHYYQFTINIVVPNEDPSKVSQMRFVDCSLVAQ